MSEEIRVGTTNITFHVTAFYPPMDIAETRGFRKEGGARIASVRRHVGSIIQGRRAKC